MLDQEPMTHLVAKKLNGETHPQLDCGVKQST